MGSRSDLPNKGLPQKRRLLVGLDHRWLLLFATLAGAALLTAADVVGRVVSRPDDDAPS
ncbi:iron chelate uptake ABC transporter family permease subunit [Micromonospora sp. NPDC049282]|uniref:iron chelate uptake ABC transporter family permease subunit n=1 Tax=Micromonospora sp. NPDC049282 TaxID=3364269 RepID=UPI0037120C34